MMPTTVLDFDRLVFGLFRDVVYLNKVEVTASAEFEDRAGTSGYASMLRS